jgi:hypothetical protein
MVNGERQHIIRLQKVYPQAASKLRRFHYSLFTIHLSLFTIHYSPSQSPYPSPFEAAKISPFTFHHSPSEVNIAQISPPQPVVCLPKPVVY